MLKQIGGLVSARREDRQAFDRSRRAWARWVPQVRLGRGRAWLSRELQWSAYMLRSGVSYEECRGRRILSQGGYYQYDLGFQGAFRDPLQHVLPLIYAEPGIARDVLLYSASEQPRQGGQVPYAMNSLCRPNDALPNANDMDLWLLWTAAEYVLATRDLSVLDIPVRFADGGRAPLWEHLKHAFAHQESLLGPHGAYLTPGAGDWSDFSTTFLQMTESTLVSAQVAYVYPRAAQLADLRGDRRFAARLRGAGARNLRLTQREWTGRGWYSRGYAGDRQIGSGAIFGEPQPWGLLAGAASPRQARILVGNVRRFLTGVGAPASVHGPAKIGSGQSPASSDPAVTERSSPVARSTGDNNAVFVGGSWYAVNGWLTWALGRQAGVVPGARRLALDELTRNTLRAHARAYPRHWGGTISVDDVCRSHNSSQPERCGIGIADGYSGQIMHQPAWLLWDTIKLAGIEPTVRGYTIDPLLPVRDFSLRLPNVGLTWRARRASGYVRAVRRDRLRMVVRAPSSRALSGARRRPPRALEAPRRQSDLQRARAAGPHGALVDRAGGAGYSSRSSGWSSARNTSVALTRLLTSSASERLSLRKIELMCFSTARLVSTSDSAIDVLLLPTAISASTSRSRGVSSINGDRSERAFAATSVSTIFGSITEPPDATDLIAHTSSARSCTRCLSR